MNVSLTSHLNEYIKRKVDSGGYNSASEVLRESLRLMEQRDQLQQLRLEQLRGEIAVGIDQIEAGQGVELDGAGMKSLVQNIKTQGRAKLAQQGET